MGITKAVIMFPVLFWFLFFSTISSTLSSSPPCNEMEKDALLKFKEALNCDPAGNKLSSWSDNEDCCKWHGVRCHNITGRVIQLHLRNPCYSTFGISCEEFALGGKVSPVLLQLEFLNYLDLSFNDFGGAPIPSFLGSMRSLTYLDLSHSSFGGLIPPDLGNLSNLHYLSLGGGNVFALTPSSLYVEKLDWISHLSSLEHLSMYMVDLHKEVHWLELTSMLSSLSELVLFKCALDNMSPSLKYANFTSLTFLNLSFNHFNHEIPIWLFNLNTSLLVLYLYDCSLKGHISAIAGFRHLNSLDLSYNQLTGQIPESLRQLKRLESLTSLSLSGNGLNGTLPSSVGFLPNLEEFSIGDNPLLLGTVSEAHLKKFSKLKWLEMPYASLIFKFKSNWVPPFQLEYLYMSSSKMGPQFPSWLQTQTSLQSLDISNTGILGVVPTWLWKWASRINERIDLSNNKISGNLSGVWLNNTVIYLNSNRFSGPLPALSPNVVVLNMANNSFSGSISHFLCQNLNGRSKLGVLDLSNNELSGELPQCWMSWPSLTHLNLGNNKFSGKIPDSISSLVSLKALHLQKNSFSESIPSSLRDCISLELLDLSGNELLGSIPKWIGEFSTLRALCLRSNKFSGEIPSQICYHSSLIVLDLADNELSGTIPKCLNNFSLMAAKETSDDMFLDLQYSILERYVESLVLMTVGRELEYKRILKYVRMIDLSSNNLSGSIPTALSQIAGLRFLNLSQNHLMGSIPEKIGRMTSLLSLDLSKNHLSGEIPQSLADLTFLNRLNLSYNQLGGRIPLSTQLQSFDAFSYIGNAQLCGAPLVETCKEDVEYHSVDAIDKENEEGFEIPWFYLSMGVGFVVGFWGVCGALIFKKRWRYAYFQFVDVMIDWVYVGIAIRLNWFRDNFRSLVHHCKAILNFREKKKIDG